jgi:hypothetical protein
MVRQDKTRPGSKPSSHVRGGRLQNFYTFKMLFSTPSLFALFYLTLSHSTIPRRRSDHSILTHVSFLGLTLQVHIGLDGTHLRELLSLEENDLERPRMGSVRNSATAVFAGVVVVI